MKNIYIAVAVLVGAVTYGHANAADSNTLDGYYDEYASSILIPKAYKVVKRPAGGSDCYPYGDQTVGYYQSKEQYQNAYDPSIFAQE